MTYAVPAHGLAAEGRLFRTATHDTAKASIESMEIRLIVCIFISIDPTFRDLNVVT